MKGDRHMLKGKKATSRIGILIGILMVAVIIAILYTNYFSKDRTADNNSNTTVDLIKYKSAYVGDNSNIINLLSELPLGNYRNEVSLETSSKPYGISVKYDLSVSSMSIEAIEATFEKIATMIFALIDNVDQISFIYEPDNEIPDYVSDRTQIQKSYVHDLRAYADDRKAFETLLNSLSLTFSVFPEKYTLTMSSTPGIKILADYEGDVNLIEYETDYGRLLTWDQGTGKITEHGLKYETSVDMPVYWSAMENVDNQITVIATVKTDDNVVAQKKITIKYNPETYLYEVIPTEDVTFVDKAASD
jgi:Tfp pilus assembly major pilin PilA